MRALGSLLLVLYTTALQGTDLEPVLHSLALGKDVVASEASLAADWERILVPFAFGNEIPGARGSLWIAQLIVRNDSDHEMSIDPVPPLFPCGITCVRMIVPPRSEISNPFGFRLDAVESFLYVHRLQSSKASFNLRIQDLSREAQSSGTEIPVIRESEYRTGEIQLLNVPVDHRFRHSLRVYDFEARDGERIHMRIYPLGSNTPVLETELTLHAAFPPHPELPPIAPASTRIHDLLSRYPSLGNFNRVRIQLTTLRPGARFWAFMSITNNETQHVTTITPQ